DDLLEWVTKDANGDGIAERVRQVSVGPNRIPETARRGDDTMGGGDATVWTVGAPRSGVPAGARGANTMWRVTDGPFRIDPARGRGIPVHAAGPVEVRVGTPGTGATSVEVRSVSASSFLP